MVGIGPSAGRQARREWWRRQIQRHKDGSLTVAEFCRRLGVSTVTAYASERRFREAPPDFPIVPDKPSVRPMHEANRASTPVFLPLSILHAGPARQLEIELADACIVQLKGAVDPELLRIAIRAAGQLDEDRRGRDRATRLHPGQARSSAACLYQVCVLLL
jgi:hypothetical protein